MIDYGHTTELNQISVVSNLHFTNGIMATRSAIGYRKLDNSVCAVYCHYDGYPQNQLPILEKHYGTIHKVKELIRPGSMSSLRTRQVWEHSNALRDANGILRDAEGNVCYVNDRDPQPLYHAERGDGEPPASSDSPLDYWFHQHDCEYLYVFEADTKTWTVYSSNDPFDE